MSEKVILRLVAAGLSVCAFAYAQAPAPKQATPAPAAKKAAPAAGTAAKKATPATPTRAALLNPPALKARAPETFKAKFSTTAGDFVVNVTRAWSPLGADRFYNLVKNGFYNDTGFFRVVPGFVVQFGLNGDPRVNAAWDKATIQDDPVTQSNKRGTLCFAKPSFPNSRTTQVFINYGDNARLDQMGFSVFGDISPEDMKVVDKINSEYGQNPDQGAITTQGNKYLKAAFPKMDFIKTAVIEGVAAPAPKPATPKAGAPKTGTPATKTAPAAPKATPKAAPKAAPKQ